MAPDPRLLADIRAAEGYRLTAYRDSRGFWTIGYGHKLDQSIDWEGHTITAPTADSLLALDVQGASLRAQALPEWHALDTDCRQNAVIELVFNMGETTWEKFHHCRDAIEFQDWETAAQELLHSDWALEVQPHGLDRPGRAKRLADYLRLGEYPC